VVGVSDPYGHINGFLDRSRYFFFEVASRLYSGAEWFQTHHFSENVAEPEIEQGPLNLQARTLTTKPQRAVYFLLHNI
jgi:hypothetical protein